MPAGQDLLGPRPLLQKKPQRAVIAADMVDQPIPDKGRQIVFPHFLGEFSIQHGKAVELVNQRLVGAAMMFQVRILDLPHQLFFMVEVNADVGDQFFKTGLPMRGITQMSGIAKPSENLQQLAVFPIDLGVANRQGIRPDRCFT